MNIMNNDQTTTQASSNADEALGWALGAAIKARVDAPIENPPISLIAKRAEAQARVRTTQRTLVSLAASVTLLAGGLFAYNALSDESSSSTVASDPTVTAVDGASTTPTTVATDEVPFVDGSTPSTLTWAEVDATEFAPDLLNVYNATTVGDGRVLAFAWGEVGAADSLVAVSANGSDWTQLLVPSGVSPDFVDISGDRWLLAGQDTTEFDAPSRAFFSDDQGTEWTELAFEQVPEGASMTLALVSGEHLVFVFKIPADRSAHDSQVQALIEASGLVSSGTAIEGWSLENNTVSFWTADALAPHSFEISDAELNALDASVGDTRIRVYASSGEAATESAEYVSWHTTGFSNDEGFYVAITTPDDELLLSSSDGQSWLETSIDRAADPTSGPQTSTRDDQWFVSGYQGELRIQSLDQLVTPDATTATMSGMGQLVALDVGPTGMAATAFAALEASEQPEPSDWDNGSFARDTLVGWSTDGTNWVWQTPTEAFGIAQRQASVKFAVGSDFVLAQVTGFAATSDGTSLEAQPPRWFKASLQ